MDTNFQSQVRLFRVNHPLSKVLNVLILSVSSDIIRVNHPSSEVLATLELVLHRSFVLKVCLTRWKEEIIFKMPLVLIPKQYETLGCGRNKVLN